MSEDAQRRQVLPVTEEEVNVHRRRRQTGKVHVYKKVHQREEVVDEPLTDTEVDVRRVEVGEFVDEPAETRREGDTTVIPVHEEVVVTEKRLRLKEEIHVTRRDVTRRRPETVVVRREEVVVTRDDDSEQDDATQTPERSS